MATSPNLFTPFFLEELVKTQNIISLGLVEQDLAAPVSKSGEYFSKLFVENLKTVSSAQRITTSTTLVPTTVSDIEEKVVVCHVGDSYYDYELENITQGIQKLKMMAQQIVPVAVDAMQDYLVSVTKGVFATELATSHVYDASLKGDGTIKPGHIVRACQNCLGEELSNMDSIIVHSKIYSDAVNLGMVTYINAGTFGEKVLVSGDIPTIAGKRVVIDDTLCAIETTKYPSYIIAGQPWYLGFQRNVRTDTDKDILTAGGKNIIAWYVDFAPHIKGVGYAGAVNPTTATLETGASWTKKAENRNIKIVKLLTLGAEEN